jgi:hypothetical protein
MTGIGGTPPASPSPRKPMKSSQEELPTPRALEVQRTSPRKNFPITKAEALQKRKEEKEKQIIEELQRYESKELSIVIETQPEIETVQIVSSPRTVESEATPEAPRAAPEKQTFGQKLAFFEGRAAIITTTSSRPPDRPLPAPPADPEVHSPRRQTLPELPPLDQSQSEKPS